MPIEEDKSQNNELKPMYSDEFLALLVWATTTYPEFFANDADEFEQFMFNLFSRDPSISEDVLDEIMKIAKETNRRSEEEIVAYIRKMQSGNSKKQ